jgi:hypothetical protein
VDDELLVALYHLGKIFERHVCAGAGIVETSVCVFFDYYRVVFCGHQASPETIVTPKVALLGRPDWQDRRIVAANPSILCTAKPAPPFRDKRRIAQKMDALHKSQTRHAELEFDSNPPKRKKTSNAK